MDDSTGALYVTLGGTERRIGGLRRVGAIAPRAGAIDVTPLDSPVLSFIKGKTDFGALKAECYPESESLALELLTAAAGGGSMGVRLATPGGAVLRFSGHIASVSYTPGVPDEVPELIAEFKISGAPGIDQAEE